MRVLLIDDVRKPAYILDKYGIAVTDIAESYTSGIGMLTNNPPYDLLCLDHDLSSYLEIDGKVVEKTGYDVMCFLEQNPEYMPKDILFVSANPVGVENMKRVYDSIKSRKE